MSILSNKTTMYIVMIAALCSFQVRFVDAREQTEKPKTSSQVERRKLSNIHLVYVDMPEDEVAAVMGEKLKIGYETKENNPGFFEPLYANQPVRTERFSAKKKKYEVSYYFTQIVKPDAIISDDELTPVVFLKNKVVAKGWDDLFELKKK